MLPMIISAGAANAVVMAELISSRNLGAIQNLGAMDVLCTDKTGTPATEDRMVGYLQHHGRRRPRP